MDFLPWKEPDSVAIFFTFWAIAVLIICFEGFPLYLLHPLRLSFGDMKKGGFSVGAWLSFDDHGNRPVWGDNSLFRAEHGPEFYIQEGCAYHDDHSESIGNDELTR